MDEARLKRLRMRSWRRGTKEMDLILGPYSDTQLEAMTPAELDLYEQLLDENDQDLYLWVAARLRDEHPGPQHLAALLDRVADHAQARLIARS